MPSRKLPAEVKVQLKGLKETQAKMEQVVRDMSGPLMFNAMRDAALIVTRTAKKLAPVDTGRLRASITPDVVKLPAGGVMGVVGSNLEYAPYMELGTGVFAGNSAVKMPPPSALELWAQRHGIASGFLVARAIWRRGGLEARKFLERGVTENQEKIRKLLSRVVADIVAK